MNFHRSIIIAELWRPEIARRWKIFFRFFCIFWKNDTLEENFQNSVPKGFITKPIDVLCSNFVKFGWPTSVKSCIRCALERESNRLLWLKPSFEQNYAQCMRLCDCLSIRLSYASIAVMMTAYRKTVEFRQDVEQCLRNQAAIVTSHS